MTKFTLLWGKLLHSSIWIKESKETRLVWLTILMLKDSDGKVMASVIGLADAAKVSVDECKTALEILTSPDPDDTSGKCDGRRLEKIQGGWQVINYEAYQFSTEGKREYWRMKKAAAREAEKKALETLKAKAPKNGKPITGEITAKKLAESGATQEQIDKVSDGCLPESKQDPIKHPED